MKPTLITGATGFVGSHACEVLSKSVSVIAIARSTSDTDGLEMDGVVIERWDGSTNHLAAIVAAHAPGRILHLGGRYVRNHSQGDVAPLVEDNVRFGSQVLEVAATASPQPVVVLAGTYFQHYRTPGNALNLYAALKNATHAIARYYGDAAGLRWAQLVLYDIYGPGDERPKLVNAVVGAIAAGRPVSIPESDPVVHLIHVDDAVAALIATAAALENGEIDTGSDVFSHADDPPHVSEVVRIISRIVDTPAVVSDDPYQLPPRAITVPLVGPRPPGWRPRISLEDGLGDMLQEIVA